MTTWQSILSVIPPWPGIEWPKSLTLRDLLSPEAKKPPKGATSDAKAARATAWSCIGLAEKVKLPKELVARRCRAEPKTPRSAPAGSRSSETRNVVLANVAPGSHLSAPIDRSVRGHVSQVERDIASARNHEASTVPTAPPAKPSHVFLGLSLISGVLPKKKPATYAAMSLMTLHFF